MPNTVIALKKSATPSASPADLANGELAINYADGKLFYKNTAGYIAQISGAGGGGGGNSFGTVNANNTLVVADTTGAILTLVTGNNISIVGDAVNDKVTIGIKDSPTFFGDTTVSGGGKFIAGTIGGDEGGEILLEKPPNGTLNGGITIDSYQNKLRIFEQGGSARGVYIDLTAAGAGVATDLLNPSATPDTTARAAASAAFDKANSANILAFNTGIGANAYATAAAAGANTYLLATLAGANTAVGTGANTYLLATLSGANTAVGTGANTYLLATLAGANTAVGTGANTYLLATLAGANTAVGTGANTYLLATLAGANTAVGTGANAFAVATFSSANTIPVGNTIGSTYTLRSTRKSMNFIPGNNISINVDDDSSGDRANVTITAVAGSLQGANLTTQIITANTVTAVKDFRYILSNTTFTTLTLPGSPTLGDTIYIVIANGLANNIVARNGNRIMGLAEDLTIDIANIALGLVYADTNLGWRIT